ncbi:MAG TPA: copper homeostasis protein CutC [Gemmatimonadales bacterium]
MRAILVEAAVDSAEAALAAVEAGAERVELCSDLDSGGLTPSAALLADLRPRLDVPILPMIRSRRGDFQYDAEEIETMLAQLHELRTLGADGFVFGALRGDRSIDTAAMARIVEAAEGLPVVLHRAFDRTPDLSASLQVLIGLGIERVLTSGGAERAILGVDRLASLMREARGRIGILPGGGIDAGNVHEIAARTGVTEVHARCERDGERVRGIMRALELRREIGG